MRFPPPAQGDDQELHLLAPPLAPAMFKRLPPVAAPVELTPFAGRYHSTDLGVTYDVAVVDQTLVIARPRIANLVVSPIGADRFAGASGSPTVTFQRTGAGVSGMTISMGRVRRLPFTRAGEARPTSPGR